MIDTSEREHWFETIVRKSLNGIAVVQDGRVVFVNEALCAIGDYAPGEMESHPMTDFVHPDDRDGLVARYRETLHKQRNETPWRWRFRGRRGYRWVESRGTHIDYQGRPASLAFVRDVDAQVRAEAALHRSNRMLRMISDCNQALVRVSNEQELLDTICGLLVSEGGYVLAWVGEAERDEARRIRPLAWAGMEDDYLKSVRISWADDEYGQGPSGRAVRSGRPVVCQDILHHPMFAPWREEAARRGYAASVALPLKVDGRVHGTLNIYASEPHAFDAEELALLEELASDLGFGLEVMSHRREKDRLEAQFIEAQKMEAVGRLAGGIAHDFNNMLAAMIGTAYLVRAKLGDRPELAEKIRTLEETGFRAAEMIKQMLTFARKGEVHRKPLPLKPFVKEVFKLARVSVPESVEMALDADIGEACTVNADATLLQQVLLNLVQNARRAVDGVARPQIRVELARETPDAAWLARHGLDAAAPAWARLTVRDNGCGMSDEVRKRIFEPFFTTRPVGEGTGLGLAMSLGAVQSHGGVIEVESAPGEGSAFHVWLPLLACETEMEPAEEAAPEPGHGELVLLVDDEPGVRDVTREVLESLNYRVLTAADGERALALFEQHRGEVAIAVLDVVMPHMGGVEALRRMRAARPDLPVVFQTGYGEDLVREGIGELERGAVMTKPVDVPAFSRMLRRLLEQ